ncbi:MAG: hypothetical protein ACLQGP_38675 [Isosphaeraceae bacterium]
MHIREWMQSGLGMAGAMILAGRARGDDPVDDSDPAPLIKKLGPMMSKIPITTAEVTPGLHLVQGPGGNIAVLTQDLDSTWAKGFFTGGMFTRVAYAGVLKHRSEKES